MEKRVVWVIEERLNDGSWLPVDVCFNRKDARELKADPYYKKCRIKAYAPKD